MAADECRPPLVLKLGGSLAESGALPRILALTRRAGRPLVVVPGGGPFADGVREAQRQVGFSDPAAHRMAILAMHQMAEFLIDLEPALVLAETIEQIKDAWTSARTPVWLPLRLAGEARELPQSWSVTSDGLAAWLAVRLGGIDVALVKSCTVDRSWSLDALEEKGITDPAFTSTVAIGGLTWDVICADDTDRLSAVVWAAKTLEA